jgi:hypothetical protein
MLMSGRFSPGQDTTFDEYYQKYLLPRWTAPDDIAKLPAYRKELRNSHFGRKSAAADVHDHLNRLVLNFMKDLVAGSYHPAVQVNAMLMIGELNSVEQPPTPLPEALPLLTAALASSNVSDAVRAAALVGIQRHAAAGISDADARRSLTNALLKLVNSDLPSGTASAGRQWILAQAIQALASLESPGEGNVVYQAILKTVGNEKRSIATRDVAASALGQLNYSGANGIQPSEAAIALGQLVRDACADELNRSKSRKPAAPISRPRMQQCLIAVRTALEGDGEPNHNGIASLAKSADQKTPVDQLKKLVDNMSERLEKSHEDDDLTDSVDKLQADLESWLKKG